MDMSLYVRVKRKKTTYFVEVEPSETILEVKQKIGEHCSARPEEQQIMIKRSGGWTALDDSMQVKEAEIQNDDVLALCLQTQGPLSLDDSYDISSITDGTFEAVDVTPYEVEMAAS